MLFYNGNEVKNERGIIRREMKSTEQQFVIAAIQTKKKGSTICRTFLAFILFLFISVICLKKPL